MWTLQLHNNTGLKGRLIRFAAVAGSLSVLAMPTMAPAQSSGPVSLQRNKSNSVLSPIKPVAAPSSVKQNTQPIQDQEKKPDERLKDIDNALKAAQGKRQKLKERAAGLDGDIKKLREGMVSAARLIQDHERRVEGLSNQLLAVNSESAEKETTLRQRRKQMGSVLQALQRVAQYPPEALIAQPITPGDTVRTAILLRSTMPDLARRALLLRDDLSVLASNKLEAQRRREELNEAKTELEGQRKLLRTMLGRKSRLRRRTVAKEDAAARKADALAVEARSIRDLMRRLEGLRKQREDLEKAQKKAKKSGKKPIGTASGPPPDYTGKPIDVAKGTLPYPVVGDVLARFGQTAKSGLTHKGIRFNAVSEAQVIVPYEGRVAFTGPFKGYGRLLIIEHGAGYHTLLAGLGRIDVAVGQWVLSGEPVGIMDRVGVNHKGSKPSLYLELRRGGQPINPLPWLAARSINVEKSKVSG